MPKRQTVKQMSIKQRIAGKIARLQARRESFLARRPHRSFRRTYRRDYVVSTGLPGYFTFTAEVYRLIRKHIRMFALLVAVFSVLSIALAGLTSQETYLQAQELLNESKGEVFSGAIGKIGEASLLILAGFTGGASNITTEQQIYLGFTLLMTWLATVWLLREMMAGQKPRLRDGLYNSGAPIVPTMLLVFVLALQFVPVGLVSLAYAALSSVGIIDGGFGAMLFAVVAVLIAALVLYWAVSTFIALIIVTLPGMYPYAALKAAGDLVTGRRLAILYRLLWLIFILLLAWAFIMVPLVVLDGWLKSIWQWYENAPLVPVLVTTASTLSFVWASAYIYLLYRKLVDHGATS